MDMHATCATRAARCIRRHYLHPTHARACVHSHGAGCVACLPGSSPQGRALAPARCLLPKQCLRARCTDAGALSILNTCTHMHTYIREPGAAWGSKRRAVHACAPPTLFTWQGRSKQARQRHQARHTATVLRPAAATQKHGLSRTQWWADSKLHSNVATSAQALLIYKLCTACARERARRGFSEVTPQSHIPVFSSSSYPACPSPIYICRIGLQQAAASSCGAKVLKPKCIPLEKWRNRDHSARLRTPQPAR